MRKALLVGINKYPAPNELNGCVNDVRQMRDILTGRYGFTSGDIKMLLDGDATLAKIEAGLAWLAEAGPGGGDGAGDVRVFHYSGHGTQTEDKNGDEPDGADEALCPVDCDTEGPLVDDRLRVLYRRVPKHSALVLLLDCCNSGGGNRPLDLSGREISYRFIPPSEATRAGIERAHEKYIEEREGFVRRQLRDLMGRGPVSDEEFEKIYAETRAKFDGARSRYGDVVNRENNLLLAGCRSDQTSADARIGGAFHGAFTYHFAAALGQLPPEATYRQVMDLTAKSLGKANFAQVPQLEGRASRKDRALFSPFT